MPADTPLYSVRDPEHRSVRPRAPAGPPGPDGLDHQGTVVHRHGAPHTRSATERPARRRADGSASHRRTGGAVAGSPERPCSASTKRRSAATRAVQGSNVVRSGAPGRPIPPASPRRPRRPDRRRRSPVRPGVCPAARSWWPSSRPRRLRKPSTEAVASSTPPGTGAPAANAHTCSTSPTRNRARSRTCTACSIIGPPDRLRSVHHGTGGTLSSQPAGDQAHRPVLQQLACPRHRFGAAPVMPDPAQGGGLRDPVGHHRGDLLVRGQRLLHEQRHPRVEQRQLGRAVGEGRHADVHRIEFERQQLVDVRDRHHPVVLREPGCPVRVDVGGGDQSHVLELGEDRGMA